MVAADEDASQLQGELAGLGAAQPSKLVEQIETSTLVERSETSKRVCEVRYSKRVCPIGAQRRLQGASQKESATCA